MKEEINTSTNISLKLGILGWIMYVSLLILIWVLIISLTLQFIRIYIL